MAYKNATINKKIGTTTYEVFPKSTFDQIFTAAGGTGDTLTQKFAAIEDASTGILATAEAYTDGKIGVLPTPSGGTQYANVVAYVSAVEAALSGAISGSLHFKGIVNYQDQLPAVATASDGDVYMVKYRGTSTQAGTDVWDMEFVRITKDVSGTPTPEWIELGGITDLSNYYTKTQIDTIVGTYAVDPAGGSAAATSVVDYVDKKVAYETRTFATIYTDSTEPAGLTANDIWLQIAGE